jgi:Arc/MetJ family transcription regulator
MRTTLHIDEELLAKAMKETGAGTKTEAVRLGLEALVAVAARRRLAALHGKLPDAVAPPRRRVRGRETAA